MASRKKRIIKKSLGKKGFQVDSSRDHVFLFYHFQGKRTAIFTKLSHGSGSDEVYDGLLGKMARQCRLNKERFLELVDCPLSAKGYRALLCEGGHLDC